MKKLLSILALSLLLTMRAGAGTIQSYPTTNQVQATAQIMLNVPLGGTNYVTVIIPFSSLLTSSSTTNVLASVALLNATTNQLKDLMAFQPTNGPAAQFPTWYGVINVRTNINSTNLAQINLPTYLSGGGYVTWGLTGILYGDDTHPGHGEFIVGSLGSMAIDPDLNQTGGTHIQYGQSGPAHDIHFFQYDDTPSASFPLGFSKAVQYAYRFWSNGAIQFPANYLTTRAEALDTNGNGAWRIYNPGLAQPAFGGNNFFTGGKLMQDFRYDGAVLNGKLITGFSAPIPVGITNVPVDYAGAHTIQPADLTAAAFLYETNVPAVTTNTEEMDIYLRGGLAGWPLTVPTNWNLEISTNSLAAAPTATAATILTNVPPSTQVHLHVTKNLGTTTNTTVWFGVANYAPILDPDAATFITTAGISSGLQKQAINSLVLAMKADGTWAKMDAIYPFVGGAATPHSYNLRNTAKFQITWNGSVTHNANGITGDGSTGYGDTGMNPNTATSPNNVQNSASIGFYNKTLTPNTPSKFMGVVGSNPFPEQRVGYTSPAYLMWGPNDPNNNQSATPATGTVIATRTSSTVVNMYMNGVGGNVTVSSVGTANANIYVLAEDSGGVNNATTANLAFAFIGGGLSSTDASNLTADILAYETTLGRQ